MERAQSDDMQPDCLGPLPPELPSWTLPEGAWDTSFHVIAPPCLYPMARGRACTPPPAPLEAALALHDTLGLRRGVLVQSPLYGLDNSALLDALARTAGRYFGAVRIDASVTRDICERLDGRGVRGICITIDPRAPQASIPALEHAARCIRGLGWFLQIETGADALGALSTAIDGLGVPVVLDRLGGMSADRAQVGPESEALLALCDRPQVWVRLNAPDRLSRAGFPYADLMPIVHRVLEAAPGRVLWGSDWPHPGYSERGHMPADHRLLDVLPAFVPDERERRRLLVENPERLLGIG